MCLLMPLFDKLNAACKEMGAAVSQWLDEYLDDDELPNIPISATEINTGSSEISRPRHPRTPTEGISSTCLKTSSILPEPTSKAEISPTVTTDRKKEPAMPIESAPIKNTTFDKNYHKLYLDTVDLPQFYEQIRKGTGSRDLTCATLKDFAETLNSRVDHAALTTTEARTILEAKLYSELSHIRSRLEQSSISMFRGSKLMNRLEEILNLKPGGKIDRLEDSAERTITNYQDQFSSFKF